MNPTDFSYYENHDITRVATLKYGTTKQSCYLGVGALNKFGDILDAEKPSCIGFVTSRSAYFRCGAWDVIKAAVESRGIEIMIFDKIVTNPTTHSIDEAVAMFKPKYDENFMVCSIGGGSPGDAAKSIAILLAHQDKDARALYKFQFTPDSRAKLVMVNITAGTGTECDCFAVASILDESPPKKPVIGYASCYPDYSINDPSTLTSTSAFQTRFTAIDALNHVMEASTTTIATPFSITLGQEVCKIVAFYLPKALADPKDLRARYWLHYAAAIAGMSFDESVLHVTHALEHTLSAYVADLTHGLGLALIQPGVLRHIWPATGITLAHVLRPMLGDLTGAPEEAEEAAKRLRKWQESVGVTETMASVGFKKTDVAKLVASTHACPGMDGLLSLSPVKLSDDGMTEIFTSGFFE
eukprot:gnl/Dysnectes_brevis/395_a437_6499.p1 GENE.gnl/Dysnectes_brevis/395_a437_6499~~gnl/Dysnectes_brevis/395_a437_6499.p1  ORF type:complete len:412 (-),score=162.68 gnl/Dysnectes_brevis/395_a437_6499:90-1325(-)